jgi:hypothetical protein
MGRDAQLIVVLPDQRLDEVGKRSVIPICNEMD